MAGGSPPPPWAYTRAQRGGLIALLAILIGGYFASRWWPASAPPDFGADDAALLAAAERLRQADQPAPTTATAAAEPFPFDANTVTATDLQQLGLTGRQATAVLRYRQKRPFRTADDFRRLRVLRPEQADRLATWARYPQRPSVPSPPAGEEPAPPPPQRFTFDPNTLSADSLQLLGFTERQANALVKYRSYRPLTFRQPEDLLRVRALDSTQVRGLLSLVAISLPDSTAPAPRRPAPVAAAAPLDINRADAEAWTQLPGIGPTRAARIVGYRDRLGGFASVEQVAETYGLPDSVYQRIVPQLRVSGISRPLRVNRLDAQALASHPYLDRRTAQIIVRYRQNHGPFASAEDLKKVRAVSTETLAALLPYLNFDP
ncbi:helix-hairpin-helix domain-containing protein [Lewinella sp. IMCC34183]|uniref:helix-hairpin-helix domain-containing protein n=1 Tax=Lewinella sp. IMCC34183 TaxID=2248762 RepID=UPI000E22180F|nr:helix-hairpin-helix domain-containing protein [Lewinella sp. IMCC34183]